MDAKVDIGLLLACDDRPDSNYLTRDILRYECSAKGDWTVCILPWPSDWRTASPSASPQSHSLQQLQGMILNGNPYQTIPSL